MATFRHRPFEVDAVPWFKNGDHPNDGHPAKEGKVVRYWREPRTDPERRCRHCDAPMFVHGWLEPGDQRDALGTIVCPGDWVITAATGRYAACHPDVFLATYDPVLEDRLGDVRALVAAARAYVRAYARIAAPELAPVLLDSILSTVGDVSVLDALAAIEQEATAAQSRENG